MERDNHTSDAALAMRDIRKTFNGLVRALKGVDFCVERGEIHALLGENGAGKSTLMNILGGVVEADRGEIVRNGLGVRIKNSADAKRHGIGFIHQELHLVPDLTVYENIFLGNERMTSVGTLARRAMIRETEAIFARMRMSIDPRAVVGDLGATQKQVIEIAGVLRERSDLIIMDEPTTSLTEHEIEALFEIMSTLRDDGVSVIFISHKLGEVTTICDRFTVLRDGVVSGSGRIADITETDLVRLMVGRDLVTHDFHGRGRVGETALAVDGLTRTGAFEDVSFAVRRGEIVGFTGLAGDGRSELFETIFGCRPADSGSIVIDGKERSIASPERAATYGIGYAPRNRKENGIIGDLSITHNVSLSSLAHFSRFGIIGTDAERNGVLRHLTRMRLRYDSLADPITALSGGNQQKAVLARWLEANSDIIVLDNPTQGIDVGAKAEIYELLSELAEQGRAVVVLSAEYAEIARLCDRTYVMYHGRIVGELERTDLSEEAVMMYSTGLKSDARPRP